MKNFKAGMSLGLYGAGAIFGFSLANALVKAVVRKLSGVLDKFVETTEEQKEESEKEE